MGGSAAKERRKLQRKQLQQRKEQLINNAKNTKQKKLKKPKHLKRKLAQCTNEDEKREFRALQEQMDMKKKKRREKFESSIREELGEKGMVNEEGFLYVLHGKGASREMLLKIARGEIDQWKDDGDYHEQVAEQNHTDEKVLPVSTENDDNKPVITETVVEIASDKDSSQHLDFIEGKEETHTNAKKEEEEDEDDDILEKTPKRRRRGRGRKDRVEEDKRLFEQNAIIQKEAEEARKAKQENELRAKEAEERERAQKLEKERKEKEIAASKKTSKKDDKRRCIGRKPVSDFIVGQRYDGSVVYVKDFGVFVDIKCHSDAFCHVSRASDDYIESLPDLFKEGDKVSAYVVEVDRKQKRLTVTLQSDEKIEQYKKEKEKRKSEKKAKVHQNDYGSGNHIKFDIKDTTGEETKDEIQPPVKLESEMTPAELKRARKLARRAERRAQKELTGISA